jgi:hypothetical protein
LSEVRVQWLLARLAQEVAMALQYPEVRAAVYQDLRASPFKENKVHLRSYLQGEGRPLLDRVAASKGVTSEAALRTLDSLVDLEFYMPVKEHWLTWDASEALLVASDLSDDDDVLPAVFDLKGDPWPNVSYEAPPTVPTLVLVPVETDFSKPPSRGALAPQAPMYESGVLMTYANVPDDKEGWPNGSPELEIHAFVRNGAGNFIDLQCAGESQSYPYYYDQDDDTWSGTVQVILEAGVGINPVEFSMWEDDIADVPCEPNYGRPPYVTSGTNTDFGNWGERRVVVVSVNGGVKTVSYDDLGIPLALDVNWSGNHDDPVGELQGPAIDCWPTTGSTSFTIYEPSSSHPQNGYAYLNFTFGQRDPTCAPPPFSVTISGPGSGAAYESVTMTASVSQAVGAVTYSWTINGSPACSTQNTCTGQLGGEGSYTTFAVTATDAAQQVASDSRTVFAEYSGCPECMKPRLPGKPGRP